MRWTHQHIGNALTKMSPLAMRIGGVLDVLTVAVKRAITAIMNHMRIALAWEGDWQAQTMVSFGFIPLNFLAH